MDPTSLSRAEVFVRWIGATAALALVVLLAIVVAAQALVVPASPVVGGPPFMEGDLHDAARFVVHNLGAMLARYGRDDADTSPMRGRVIAGTAGLLLLTQVYQQGSRLSRTAAYLGVPSWQLLPGLLPHAVIELAAVLLPLSAATFALRAPRLREAGLPSAFQALAVALPVLCVTAAIETYVSPRVYQATACTSVETEVTALGGCKPCPRWAEIAFNEAVQRRDPVPPAAEKPISEGCRWSANTVPRGYEQPDPGAQPKTD
jgi:hypothetical protein